MITKISTTCLNLIISLFTEKFLNSALFSAIIILLIVTSEICKPQSTYSNSRTSNADTTQIFILSNGNTEIRNTNAGIRGNMPNIIPQNLFQVGNLLGFDYLTFKGIHRNDLVQDIRFNCYESPNNPGQYLPVRDGHSARIMCSVNDPYESGNGVMHISLSSSHNVNSVEPFNFGAWLSIDGHNGYLFGDGITLKNYNKGSGRTSIGLNSYAYENISVSIQATSTGTDASALLVQNLCLNIDKILLHIRNDGHIGIGTYSWDERLLIRGLSHGDTCTTTNLQLIDNANKPLLTVKDNGNVGINNSNPDAKLTIIGSGTTNTTTTLNITDKDTNTLFKITDNGWVQIGNSFYTPNLPSGLSNRFSVDGQIIAKDIKVKNMKSGWSDFVFSKDYKLLPINELEKQIKKIKHLPGIPSKEEVNNEGIDLGEIQAKLLQKIEELTLYVIELDKKNEALSKELEAMKEKIQYKH